MKNHTPCREIFISRCLGLLQVLLVLLVVFRAEAQQFGKESGGGGTVVRFAGQIQFFLLDRLMLNLGLARLTQPPLVNNKTFPSRKSLPTIGPLIQEDYSAFIKAKELLAEWQRTLQVERPIAASMMEIIAKAIDEMSYQRTNLCFHPIKDRLVLPKELMDLQSELATAILFLNRFGSIISSPVWDGVGIEVQVGLIVHEALRHLQGTLFLGDLTDTQLQTITAMIVDLTPSAEINFEKWMSPRLYNLSSVKAGANSARNPIDKAIAALVINEVQFQHELLSSNQRLASKYITGEDALRELVSEGVLRDCAFR